KVHRTLEREHAALARLDAEVAEHLLVGGLALAPGERDAHAGRRFAPQERHRAKGHAKALEHRPGAGEFAFAQPLDREFAAEGRIARNVGAPAEDELLRAALPDLVRAPGGLRVDEKAEDGVLRVLA